MLANFGTLWCSIGGNVTDFGKQLKSWRKRNRVSVLRISKETGVARETITNIEEDLRQARDRTLSLLRDYMRSVDEERTTDVLASDAESCPAGVVVLSNPCYKTINALCEFGRIILVNGKTVKVFRVEKED